MDLSGVVTREGIRHFGCIIVFNMKVGKTQIKKLIQEIKEIYFNDILPNVLPNFMKTLGKCWYLSIIIFGLLFLFC